MGGVRTYGPKAGDGETCTRASLVAFNVEGVHASDLAFFLDQDGVAIRTGHHCTQPLHKNFLDAGGSARASCYFYNSKKDIDIFVEKLKSTIAMFRDLDR